MFDWISHLFYQPDPELDELPESEFEEPDYPLPICCPFCKSDDDWADTEKGYCRYCGYYLP